MQVYMKQQPSNSMAPNARSKNTLAGEAPGCAAWTSLSAWHSHSGRRSVVVGSGALPSATSGNDGLPCAAHQRPNPQAAGKSDWTGRLAADSSPSSRSGQWIEQLRRIRRLKAREARLSAYPSSRSKARVSSSTDEIGSSMSVEASRYVSVIKWII